jgi:hypothetical protein
VSFLRRTAGRSKGSSVSSVMAAVALGGYARQLVGTTICYVNRRFVATAVSEILTSMHNPG